MPIRIDQNNRKNVLLVINCEDFSIFNGNTVILSNWIPTAKIWPIQNLRPLIFIQIRIFVSDVFSLICKPGGVWPFEHIFQWCVRIHSSTFVSICESRMKLNCTSQFRGNKNCFCTKDATLEERHMHQITCHPLDLICYFIMRWQMFWHFEWSKLINDNASLFMFTWWWVFSSLATNWVCVLDAKHLCGCNDLISMNGRTKQVATSGQFPILSTCVRVFFVVDSSHRISVKPVGPLE